MIPNNSGMSPIRPDSLLGEVERCFQYVKNGFTKKELKTILDDKPFGYPED